MSRCKKIARWDALDPHGGSTQRQSLHVGYPHLTHKHGQKIHLALGAEGLLFQESLIQNRENTSNRIEAERQLQCLQVGTDCLEVPKAKQS